jgi:hypothetical protein
MIFFFKFCSTLLALIRRNFVYDLVTKFGLLFECLIFKFEFKYSISQSLIPLNSVNKTSFITFALKFLTNLAGAKSFGRKPTDRQAFGRQVRN